jgi:AcrR family transcriptional regulator
MDMDTGSHRLNQTGQAMYRKGQAKRQRLVDATAELLKTTSFADLKPGEIARLAGTSKSNFYLYFEDVRAALLAAVQDVSLATPEVLATLDAPWTARDGLFQARVFVATYLRLWDAHAAVLRVRTALVAEGDARFKAAEAAASAALLEALSQKIEQSRKAGGVPLAPHAGSLAVVILAMLDRLAAYGPDPLDAAQRRGVTPALLIDSAAAMIAALLVPASEPTSGRRQRSG